MEEQESKSDHIKEGETLQITGQGYTVPCRKASQEKPQVITAALTAIEESKNPHHSASM